MGDQPSFPIRIAFIQSLKVTSFAQQSLLASTNHVSHLKVCGRYLVLTLTLPRAGAWQLAQSTLPFLVGHAVQPRPGLAFYHERSNARPFIAQINQAANLSQEGPTQDAWQLVVKKYFPDEETAVPANAIYFTTWAVIREGYRRAGVGADLNKPDVIVIRTNSTPLAGGNYNDIQRDMLTIECKNPKENNQSSWRTLIDESVQRLREYFPCQSTFLIAAVGSNYMFFFWDHATHPAAPPLTICINNGADRHRCDRSLRPLGPSRWFPNNDGTRASPARVDILWDIEGARALSILGDDQTNPEGVVSLEIFLTAVRGASLQGLNVFG